MTFPDAVRRLLADKVRSCALKYGRCQLSSGQVSDYFIHADRLTLNSDNLYDFAKSVWMCLEPFPDLVGGPSIGADPLIGSLLTLAAIREHKLGGFLIRKDGRVEGTVKAQQTAFIIEDVITTGAQTLKAVQAAEGAGAVILGVIALVDRLAGAKEMLRGRGYDLTSLVTVDDITAG